MERTTKRCAELGLVPNKEETSNIMLSTLGSFLSDPLLFCCLICISHFHNFIDLQLQAMHPHFTLPSALRPYVRSKYIHFIWYVLIYNILHIKWIFFFKWKKRSGLRIIYCLFNFCWGSHSFPTTNHFLPSLYIFVRQPIQQEIMAASSAVQFIMYLTVYLIKYFKEIITT